MGKFSLSMQKKLAGEENQSLLDAGMSFNENQSIKTRDESQIFKRKRPLTSMKPNGNKQRVLKFDNN
jgi:hypothetical protein